MSTVGSMIPLVYAYSPSPQGVTTVPSNPYQIYSDGSYLFIATRNGKVWRSDDDGGTWNKILDLGNITRISYLLEKDSQGNLWTSFDNQKVYRSTNDGDSWTTVLDLSVAPPYGYFTTGGFFDLKNGTIISALRDLNSPVVYRSNSWGDLGTWSVWKNFSQIFPDFAVVTPESTPNKIMRHTHSAYFFDSTWFVSTGDAQGGIGHWSSSDGGDSWSRDSASTFTSVHVLPDRVLLGVDIGQAGIWLYKQGAYKKVYNPNKDVDPLIVFKHFAHDFENGIIYVPIGYSGKAPETILASLDKGETWFNFINYTAKSAYGSLQVEVHKNYLWYVTGDSAYRLPKPTVAELLNAMKKDSPNLTAYSSIYSYTSLTQKAYKNAIIQVSNASWTNMATNPSFESFAETGPMNWTYWGGGWNNTSSKSEETTDKYDGARSLKIEAAKGQGSVTTYSSTFSMTEGYYFAEVRAKTNSSWARGNIEFAIYLGDGITSKNQMLYLGRINGTWQLITNSFYVSSTQAGSKARIYLILNSPSNYQLNIKVLWDTVLLVKDYDPRAFEIPTNFWTGTIYSCTGSIEVNDQTTSINSLPLNITYPYMTGMIKVKLTSARLASITISGTQILTAENATLEDYNSGMYLARYYPGSSFSGNLEKRLILAHDTTSLIKSYSYAEILNFIISAPYATTSITKVYVADKGEPTYVSGATSWSYNAQEEIVTVSILNTGSRQISISWNPSSPRTSDDYDGMWHTSDFKINLTASDPMGVAGTYYKINDGTLQNVNANGPPFITSESANNTLEYWSINNDGVQEFHHFLTGIKLDKKPPIGSIIINNGVAFTTSTSVTLTLTATDSTSGIHQARYSNDGTWDTEPWETPSPTKTWMLTEADGSKTVYVQFRDTAGMISQSYFGVIILDTTSPEIQVTFPNSGYQTNSSTITVTWIGSDQTSGINNYQIRLDHNLWVNTGTNTRHTFNNLTGGNHTVNIEATDKAGNTKQDTIEFTVNADQFQADFTGEALFIVAAFVVSLGVGLYFLKIKKGSKTSEQLPNDAQK